MKFCFRPALFLLLACSSGAQTLSPKPAAPKTFSGNPLFPGWYADPEAALFGKQYWIYPTWSAVYEEQVFFDAFSSYDLVKRPPAFRKE